jgi:HEXXH motif-containing protein
MDCAGLDVLAGLREIRAHRVLPSLFGRYYELVFAIRARRYAEAGVLFREILSLAGVHPVLTVLPFSEQALGAETARYARLLDLAEDGAIMLASPQPQQWLGFDDKVEVALDLLDNADADLAAELRALIVQIVGAVPAQNAPRRFDGASSFMLWGAIVVNVARDWGTTKLIELLVHEAAHQLLFGLSRDEPLVENAIEERFASPLRSDARPMDGVFHATFVCARVHYAYNRLRRAQSALPADAVADPIDARLDRQRRLFQDGYETVRRHAKLTATGERIISAAQAYMQAEA